MVCRGEAHTCSVRTTRPAGNGMFTWLRRSSSRSLVGGALLLALGACESAEGANREASLSEPTATTDPLVPAAEDRPDPNGTEGAQSPAMPTSDSANTSDSVDPGSADTGDSVTGDSVTGDSVTGDSVTGDSVAGDSVAGDSVAGDSVAGDSVAGDSVTGDSAAALPSAGEASADAPGEDLADGSATQSAEVIAGSPADAGVQPDASAAPSRDAGAAEPLRPLGLRWPIACTPGVGCTRVGYPDVDGDGLAFDCSAPGYHSHQGTDIDVSWEQMDAGVDVFAAADGEVLWVFDGKYDRCPNDAEPDCAAALASSAGSRDGVEVCTDLGPYCPSGDGECFWCFAGGNVVVVRHWETPGVFATRYDHLKRDSIVVAPGEHVTAGQKLAEVGSAGSSTGPHLHFEVWGETFYDLVEPWSGQCGPNTGESLWAFEPAWAAAP